MPPPALPSSTMSPTTPDIVVQPKKIPSKINQDIVFYQHQIEGIRQLAKIKSFILADDLGLGKSIQALVVAALDFDKGWATKILVIPPPKLAYNWLEEIGKLTGFTVTMLDGTPDQRAAKLAKFRTEPTDVLICGNTMIGKHSDELRAIGFDIAIVDESHELKNPKSVRTKGVQSLAKDIGRWFFLTGTPLLNQPDELWVPLNFIDSTAFPNFWAFRATFCKMGGFGGKTVVGVKRPKQLREQVGRVMLRRVKEDVLDLPGKQLIQVNLDLLSEQRRIYDKANRELLLELPDNPTPMEIESGMTKFLRLKQICSTPANLGLDDDSVKLDVAVDKIVELSKAGHKSIVFTQFRGTLEALNIRLGEAGVPQFQIHGGIKAKDRQTTVNEWTESREPAALGAMMQVGGTGLNMVAASHVLFLDKLYVPGENEQCQDRAYRIGQTQPVQVIEFICRDTIEQRIENILTVKADLFDQIINPSGWKRALYMQLTEGES